MCFTIRASKKPLKKVAKEDIIVWKRLRSDYTPQFKRLIINNKPVSYERGYIYSQTIPFRIKKLNQSYWIVDKNAFHSFLKEPTNTFGNKKIVQMIIPKGARYLKYENCYVSSKIMFPADENKKAQKVKKAL